VSVNATQTLARRRELIVGGALGPVLWRVVVPAAIWYLLNYSFFIADTYYVGKLGTQPLAAMGLITAVVVLTITLSQGLGSALAALASIDLGAGQHAPAARLISHTLWLGVAVSVVVAAIGLPTIDPLFSALGASPDQLPYIREYMVVFYLGYAFVAVPTIGQSAIRATGDVVTPAVLLMISGLVHVLLDPILIFGNGVVPALGVRGAALAALIARGLGGALTLWIVARRDRLLALFDFQGWRDSVRAVARIGLPVALQMSVLALVGAANLSIAGSLGAEAVAGIGVGFRLEAIATALVFGLPVVLPTFIGQNVGAGKPLRAGEGALLGARQVLWAQLAIALLLAVSASFVAAPFSRDPHVRDVIRSFLYVMPISYALHALTSSAAGAFIALGRMRSYLIVGALPGFLFIGMSWLGAQLFGVLGLLGALSFARIALGVVAYLWLRSVLRAIGFLPAHKADSEAPVSVAEQRSVS
jgi:putative MATE family efflux protein